MNTPENTQKSIHPIDFIPANESKPVIWFFKWYTFWLCKRRFSAVWTKNEIDIPKNASVLFLVNHHTWWDGLIPLLLNEFVFHKRARAIMEDAQMKKHTFFAKIGAMSINRSNARSAVYTLNQASEWLKQPNTCLFLYPEGKITNPSNPINIEGGVLRIIKQAPDCVVIPISVYISHQRGDKPELFVRTGCNLTLPDATAARQLNEVENTMQRLLDEVREESMQNNHGYSRLI